MRILFLISCLCIAGCSALERADILKDAAAYTGAESAEAGRVLGEAAKDIGSKVATGDYIGAVLYILAGAGAVLGGWITKKFIQKKYKNV